MRCTVQGFRLPLQYRRGLCSSGLLGNVSLQLFTNVAGQPISPTSRGQAAQEDRLIGSPKTSVHTYQHMLYNNPEV